jgi:hypothetical protein
LHKQPKNCAWTEVAPFFPSWSSREIKVILALAWSLAARPYPRTPTVQSTQRNQPALTWNPYEIVLDHHPIVAETVTIYLCKPRAAGLRAFPKGVFKNGSRRVESLHCRKYPLWAHTNKNMLYIYKKLGHQCLTLAVIFENITTSSVTRNQVSPSALHFPRCPFVCTGRKQ